ncbi:MAG: hypothetical protein CMQ51_03815 [Gammaproteobacteria bacterium]|nr:hypothetical protein [Gammaproteobacteria bacterium]|tara:strand:+ start:470 stop:1441 length:972 start_codon:yes stop_codon:yes gene_type:complete
MIKFFSEIALFILFIIINNDAYSHHGRFQYDLGSVISIQVNVKEIEWKNPHVYINVFTNNTILKIETDAIPILIRNKWNTNSLEIDEIINITYHPGISDTNTGLLVQAQKLDGSILRPRSTEQNPIYRTNDISGNWLLPNGDNIQDFLERWASTEITNKGIKAKQSYDLSDRPAGRCIETPSPMIMAMPFLNKIEIYDNQTIISNEFFDTRRVIHTDGRTFSSFSEKDYPIQGFSIGTWVDNELHIETRFFADHRAPIRGPNEGVPSGRLKKVIETYKLLNGNSSLQIDFKVLDDEFLAEEFSGTLIWDYAPQHQYIEVKCDS